MRCGTELISSSAMRLAWSTDNGEAGADRAALCVLGLAAEGGDGRVHPDQPTIHVHQGATELPG